MEWKTSELFEDNDDLVLQNSDKYQLNFISSLKYQRDIKRLLDNKQLESAHTILRGLTNNKQKYMPTNSAVKRIESLKEKIPNGSEFLDLVINQLFLHSNTRQTAPCRILPTLLVGDAGVGKTYTVEMLAATMRHYSVKISLSNASESFVLTGCPRGYGTSVPGEVADKLSKAPIINPIVILDELDKATYLNTNRPSISGPLLSLLEKDTAKNFEDSCLRMPIDTSHVSWIATANSIDGIPVPILSRFQVIHISPLSDEAKQIMISSLAKQTIKNLGLEHQVNITVDDDVRAINSSTRTIKNALLLCIAEKFRNDITVKAFHIRASDLSKHSNTTYVERQTIGFHAHVE